MSLIIYKNRTLYADRTGMAEVPSLHYVKMRKLMTETNDRFALAYSGEKLDFLSLYTSGTVATLLEELEKLEGHKHGVFKAPKGFCGYNGTILIMTAYAIYCMDTHYQFQQMELDETIVLGSGTLAAMTLMEFKPKLPVQDVYFEVSLVSQTMRPDIVDEVEMKDLVGFQQFNDRQKRNIRIRKAIKQEKKDDVKTDAA